VPRLIVVSNRVAVPGTEAPQAGGLAVAVNAALKQREGIWFGWSGKVAEDGPAPQPIVLERQRRTFITLDLSNMLIEEWPRRSCASPYQAVGPNLRPLYPHPGK